LFVLIFARFGCNEPGPFKEVYLDNWDTWFVADGVPGSGRGGHIDNRGQDDVRKSIGVAVQKLAKAYRAQELAHDAYPLYERFRPDIPAGKKGWGAKGDLDLGLIGWLAKERD
jgi:hypothetical protein